MVACPECSSEFLYRDGMRYLSDGSSIQRFLCRECGHRFSSGHNHSERHIGSKVTKDIVTSCQVCDILTAESKNLTAVETQNKVGLSAEATETTQEVKGKLLKFLWELKKEGLRDETIRIYSDRLKVLVNSGADLSKPETVKEALAKDKHLNDNTKLLTVYAYSNFL